MVNVTPELIQAFQEGGITLIPEDAADSKTKIPCITYLEQDNADNRVGDTLGYSNVSYLIQVWDYNMKSLINTCQKADGIMKRMGFYRRSCAEQAFNGLHRKILQYDKLIPETFNQHL